MKVSLSLTHRCNLSCRYCYAGKKFRRDMSLDTARKAIDFAIERTPARQKMEFSFFGGEPFLCFDLMRNATAYLREREADLPNPVSISVTSNGTLLNQPIFDFLKEERIRLCISIDGPAYIHDLYRRDKKGRGSFSKTFAGLMKALEQLPSVQVNAVYDTVTLRHLPETVAFLIESGASVIHLNMDIHDSWENGSFQDLRSAYMAVADQYIRSYLDGREIAVNLIDGKSIVFLKGGYSWSDRCGMGDSEWGIAPSGNIYPCERFIGEDDNTALCLGNVHSGIDVAHRCSVVKHRGNRNQECKTCKVRNLCMNWCGCTNYFMTGHADLADAALCGSERAAIQAAQHAFTTLSERENELFIDHLMRYLHETNRAA